MAPRESIAKITKITKITKDDQTSRRKRTKGLFSKSRELGIRPSCKVFTFVLYTDVGQVRTYDSTGGAILGEVEAVIEQVVRKRQLLTCSPARLTFMVAPLSCRLAAVRSVLLRQQQASRSSATLRGSV